MGGIIAVDNTLWYGKVADDAVGDKQTVALREFNARVLAGAPSGPPGLRAAACAVGGCRRQRLTAARLGADERVSHVIVPVGDGVTLLRRRR